MSYFGSAEPYKVENREIAHASDLNSFCDQCDVMFQAIEAEQNQFTNYKVEADKLIFSEDKSLENIYQSLESLLTDQNDSPVLVHPNGPQYECKTMYSYNKSLTEARDNPAGSEVYGVGGKYSLTAWKAATESVAAGPYGQVCYEADGSPESSEMGQYSAKAFADSAYSWVYDKAACEEPDGSAVDTLCIEEWKDFFNDLANGSAE